MHLGFDAKRAFLNQSGLGNYSRNLIRSLAVSFPDNTYELFTPKGTTKVFEGLENIIVTKPGSLLDKKLSARWRSYGITSLLNKKKADVFHGLSNELPFNIHKFSGKKVTTIHDLIFMRHPQLYPLIDRKIYEKKVRSAVQQADTIIATSQQTKNDLIEFGLGDENKIKVVYQSCSDDFRKQTGSAELKNILKKYSLPENYLLYVGTIEERKNLLTLLKALKDIKDIPLVVVGKKKNYYKKVKQYITANKMQGRVIFPEEISNEHLPFIYKQAEIFIYPSLFEGFGIPIIEALSSGTPVISTKGGCFAEAGGENSIYINPADHEQLSQEIKNILSSPTLRKNMSEKGLEYSKLFLPEVIANEMMKIYKST